LIGDAGKAWSELLTQVKMYKGDSGTCTPKCSLRHLNCSLCA
jgi:hypothetical protein